jgi:hypothetical protein
MVDRLSPIDRSQMTPQPVSPTAENQKTPPLAHRIRANGRSIVPNRSEP